MKSKNIQHNANTNDKCTANESCCTNLDWRRVYELSNRRSMVITLIDSKTIKIKAPKRASRREIDSFIERVSPRLNKLILEKKRQENLSSKFLSCEYVLIDGHEIRVICEKGSGCNAAVESVAVGEFFENINYSDKDRLNTVDKYYLDSISKCLYIYGHKSQNANLGIRKALVSLAKNQLANECVIAAQKYGFIIPTVSLSTARKQWGNCREQHIRLNYLLLCLPKDLRDYVIVHELCHLVHKNHQKEFWDSVYNIMPDAKKRRKRLSEYGFLLEIY